MALTCFNCRSDAEPIDLQLDYWTVGDPAVGSMSGQDDRSERSSGLSSLSGSVSKRSGLEGSLRSDSRKGGGGGGEAGGGKASIKTSIWFMQVLRLGVPSNSGEQPTFAMHYWLKEKKQKSKSLIIFFRLSQLYPDFPGSLLAFGFDMPKSTK